MNLDNTIPTAKVIGNSDFDRRLARAFVHTVCGSRSHHVPRLPHIPEYADRFCATFCSSIDYELLSCHSDDDTSTMRRKCHTAVMYLVLGRDLTSDQIMYIKNVIVVARTNIVGDLVYMKATYRHNEMDLYQCTYRVVHTPLSWIDWIKDYFYR